MNQFEIDTISESRYEENDDFVNRAVSEPHSPTKFQIRRINGKKARSRVTEISSQPFEQQIMEELEDPSEGNNDGN